MPSKIDFTIDVKNEKNILKMVDKFIQKWCGENKAHLSDSDDNDGEYLREAIRQQCGIKNSSKELREKLLSVLDEYQAGETSAKFWYDEEEYSMTITVKRETRSEE